MKQEYLRKIPAVNRLLETDEVQQLLSKYSQELVVDLVNQVLEQKRQLILDGQVEIDLSIRELVEEVKQKVLQYMSPRLAKVINATGTILHTNLGRAVLSQKAITALVQIAENYSNLEFDLNKGSRGSRYSLVTDLLCRLTGAEDALVVNNNAAAVFFILSTLAKEKEAILSRGEIVEIGGSFRISEVMKASGCKLVEVGSTNRTHLHDYETAISETTGLIVRVHTSNYQIVGFNKTVANQDLVDLGQKYKIPIYEDLGSGVFLDLEKYGVTHEPTVKEAVLAGVDLISFSGDKLLGGPQAGIIVGKKSYIQRLKKNHLLRALRIDKFTLAALEATLKHYLKEEEAINEIPTLRMIRLTADELQSRLELFIEKINRLLPTVKTRIIHGTSMVGGGSLPLEKIPTLLLAVKFRDQSTTIVSTKLRQRAIPIICRVQDDELIFDFRTVLSDQDREIVSALVAIESDKQI